MSITDELRESMMPCIIDEWLTITKDAFEAIVDRIEAEHQKAIQELNNLADASVLLPVDADGVPIRIGDVMAYMYNTKPMEVVALVPPSVFLTKDGPRYADMCRHYHKPTVEDVLRGLIVSAQALGCIDDEDELVAEYAAKLRLADDGEEQ